MEKKKSNANSLQWSVLREGKFQICGQTSPTLPPGGYSCESDSCGNLVFAKRELKSDNIIQAPRSLSAEIIDDVEKFWSAERQFDRLGLLHRRGYLFYGKQGGGKSSIIHQIVGNNIADGGVAFFCSHPHYFVKCLTQFRKVEPNRPVVCVFEDIDSIIEDWGDNLLLQWLDGNHQVSRAINLASTNYPEKLDKRIISRPRRFDRIYRIDAPCQELRDVFLQQKIPQLSFEDRKMWVERTDGFTFAAMTELIIGVFCLGEPFEITFERLQSLDCHQPTSLEFANAAS